MNSLKILITAGLAFLLIACEETPSTNAQDAIDEAGFLAVYDPSAGLLPFPTNLLFTGTDATYTLNIPAASDDSAGTANVKAALNDLDGFSTVTPISVDFSGPIDTATLLGGETVRIFEVATLTPAIAGDVTSITSELTVNVDYVLSTSSVNSEDGSELGANKLVISPLKPLKASTSYMVVVTKGVLSTSAKAAASSVTYAFTKSSVALHTAGTSDFSALSDDDAVALESLRLLNNTSEAVVSGWATANTATALTATDIVVSMSFTTQSIGNVLGALQSVVDASVSASVLEDTTVSTPFNAADIFAGTLATNYYLNAATGVNDPSPLSGSWRGAGDTALTKYNPTVNPPASTTNIPLLATIPKSIMPMGGWPVVIFQHGITRNRADILTIADTMAAQGYAVVAIDMPLHGITGDEDTGAEAFYAGSLERTFNLDLVNNDTSAAGPDLKTDLSGTHYINLASLLTTRDNVRQSIADLYVLRNALETMATETGGHSFNANEIHFVGHSMGAIAGSVFLATDTNVKSSVLAVPGGGIAKLLDGSAAFGPIIAAGLAANDVNKGTAEYETFLASAQMVIDSGDPINYASDTVAGRGVLLFEVVGDGVDNLPDQVIPNNVLTVADTVAAPLAGTDPLVSLMGLVQLDTSSTYGGAGAVVKFSGGHHGSILTPNFADETANVDPATDEYKAYAEMQAEMAEFISSNGTTLAPADAQIISAVPVP